MFLPDAKQVAIAWGSGVSLHEVETGQEIWFQSMPTNLIAFDIQAQGKVFAAGLADGSVMIFDADNGTSQRVEGREQDAYWGDIAWSPDGETLAFQFLDGSNRPGPIYLLEVVSGQISQVPESETGEGSSRNWSGHRIDRRSPLQPLVILARALSMFEPARNACA